VTNVEDTRAIDIRWMKRQGMLGFPYRGSLSWHRGEEPNGSIRYQVFFDRLELSFRYRTWSDEDWTSAKQTLKIERTPCNYGGDRPWLVCPNCHRRFAILYAEGAYFFCRKCQRLPYASQGESKYHRLNRKLDKLRDRVTDDEDYLVRKKGVHWKTFNRLCDEYYELDALWERTLYEELIPRLVRA
jgi:hypothetical protein